MSFDLNQSSYNNNNNNNDNYIQKIQLEIDSLERQLFSKEKSYLIKSNNNNNNTNNTKKNKPLRINKDLSVPVETTISNINDDTILTQQTLLNNNMTPNEKAELYKIIMRERNENAELEKLRLEQNEKYKRLKNKYKMLENENKNLKNEIDIIRKDKEIQKIKIIELQNEIQKLKENNLNHLNNVNNNININDNNNK